MYTSRGLEGRMPSKKSDHLVAVLLAKRKAATKKRYLGDSAATPTPAILGWSRPSKSLGVTQGESPRSYRCNRYTTTRF